MEGVGGGRRRMTLAEQMSVLDPSSLQDLLRRRDQGRETFTGLTLGAVLGCNKSPPPVKVNKTLLDIIRDEESGAAYRDLVGHNKKAWKSFKDRIRLRRAGAAWSSSSTTTIPVSDIPLDDCRIRMSRPFPASPRPENPIPIPVVTSPSTTRPDASPSPENSSETRGRNIVAATEPVVTRLADALAAEREQHRPAPERERDGSDSGSGVVVVVEERGEVAALGSNEGAVAPVRMSLMALLEETDRQTGVVGAALMGAEEEEEGNGNAEGGEYTCCVCMVRHKGAALIPCGHTFCRLCSRELWVSRGNCPLCNGYILEILDIF